MRISTTTLLVALASSVPSLVSAKYILTCGLAADHSGMIQQAYCCDSYKQDAQRHQTLVGTKCSAPLTEPVACNGGYKPQCCYAIDTVYICTEDAKMELSD